MKRLLLTLILLTIPTIVSAVTSWEPVYEKVSRSLARLTAPLPAEDATKVCTAFAINAREDYFLTAAHCYGPTGIYLDGQISWVVFYDDFYDLMVLKTPGAKHPSLDLSSSPIRYGTPLMGIGYAYGDESPFMAAGIVSNPYDIEPDEPPYLVTDFTFVGGMSGGPLVDEAGRVVSVIQASLDHGWAAHPSIVRELTAKFWD